MLEGVRGRNGSGFSFGKVQLDIGNNPEAAAAYGEILALGASKGVITQMQADSLSKYAMKRPDMHYKDSYADALHTLNETVFNPSSSIAPQVNDIIAKRQQNDLSQRTVPAVNRFLSKHTTGAFDSGDQNYATAVSSVISALNRSGNLEKYSDALAGNKSPTLDDARKGWASQIGGDSATDWALVQRGAASLDEHLNAQKTAELRATPLFQQAQAQLRQLDDDHCRRHDPRLDNAAAAMAVSAYKQGMRHIDHVMSSRGGPGSPAPSLLAVQGEPNTVDAKYAQIDPKQALNTPVLESAKAYEQEKIRHYSEFQHAGPRGQEPSPITHASQPAAAQGQAPTRLRDFSDSSHPQNALYNTLKEGFPPHASAELLSHATAACYRSGIKQPLDLGHVVGKEGKIFFSSNSLFSPGTTIDVMQALPSVQQTMQQVQQFDQQRANDRAQSQAQNAAQANQQQGPMLGGP